MLEPAHPSTPPPPMDDEVMPMSMVAASLWVVGIHLGFIWLTLLLTNIRAEMQYDTVAHIFCQLVVYGLGLFFLLRRYAQNSRIRDFLGARPSHWLLYLLAAVIGATATLPASALLGVIEKRWPIEEGAQTFSKLFYASGSFQKGMVALGVVVLAPVVEEALFRGAIFVPLRKRYGRWSVIAITGVLFALVHFMPQRWPPLLLMGLLMGYLRATSGTVGATMVAHAAFNAVPMSQMFYLGPEAEDYDVPDAWLIGACVACAVAVAAFTWLASSSRRASAARREDR